MTEPQDRLEKHVDALEALAAGRDQPADQPAEADSPGGVSSGLLVLSEDEQEASADPMEDTAVAEPATLPEEGAPEEAGPAPAEGDPLADMAAAAPAAGAGDVLADVASAAPAAMPGDRLARAARYQAASQRVYAHSFKRFIVPPLVVVGLMLVAASVLTLVMLLTAEEDLDAYEVSALQVYGKWFVLVALPIGAILLMGAWLFYIETKKAESRGGGGPPA